MNERCVRCFHQVKTDHGAIVEGVRFTSSGSPFSTVYDDAWTGRFLSVILCDACILSLAQSGFVYEGKPAPVPGPEYNLFQPDD